MSIGGSILNGSHTGGVVPAQEADPSLNQLHNLLVKLEILREVSCSFAHDCRPIRKLVGILCK